jgi:hypothetical protein
MTMTEFLSRVTKRIEIPINRHLHTGGPKTPLEHALELRKAREFAMANGLKEAYDSNLLGNLAGIPENQIRSIAAQFGEEGIFKLILLATSLDKSEFKHFFQFITDDLLLEAVRRGTPPLPLHPDNAILRASPELNNFNHNVINTGLSRKIYNPGRKDGYLVYGIGGPFAFTPDRVAKKIVELNEGELTWAKKDGVDPSTPVMYLLLEKGMVSAEEWSESQLAKNGPFIEMYKRDVFPDDRLIVIDEEGGVSEYPLV